MKKLMILALMATVTINAQKEFAKSSIGFQTGMSKLENVVDVSYGNWKLDYRLMIGPEWGGKVEVGYNSYHQYQIAEASIQAVFNIGRIIGWEGDLPNTTLLIFGGGAVTDSKSPTNNFIIHRDNHFNMVQGFQIEQRITKRVFLGLGANLMPGINSRPKNLGGTETTNKWEFNAFVTIPILNGHKEHADWYIPEPIINSRDTTIVENHYHEVTRMVDKPFTTYIQFAYNDFKLKDGSQGRATIKNALEAFKIGDTFLITGYASEENGTGNPDYNTELSRKRAQTVKSYLISLGVDPLDIDIEPMGALYTWDGENIELSRTVKIEIR